MALARRNVVGEHRFETAVALPKEDYSLGSPVRVNNQWIRRKGDDSKELFVRSSWVKISTEEGSVYRQVRGGSQKGLTAKSIALDYDAREILGLKKCNRAEGCDYNIYSPKRGVIAVKAVTGPIVLIALWNHHDYAYRIATRISLVAMAVSLIGLVISVVGCFLG